MPGGLLLPCSDGRPIRCLHALIQPHGRVPPTCLGDWSWFEWGALEIETHRVSIERRLFSAHRLRFSLSDGRKWSASVASLIPFHAQVYWTAS